MWPVLSCSSGCSWSCSDWRRPPLACSTSPVRLLRDAGHQLSTARPLTEPATRAGGRRAVRGGCRLAWAWLVACVVACLGGWWCRPCRRGAPGIRAPPPGGPGRRRSPGRTGTRRSRRGVLGPGGPVSSGAQAAGDRASPHVLARSPGWSRIPGGPSGAWPLPLPPVRPPGATRRRARSDPATRCGRSPPACCRPARATPGRPGVAVALPAQPHRRRSGPRPAPARNGAAPSAGPAPRPPPRRHPMNAPPHPHRRPRPLGAAAHREGHPPGHPSEPRRPRTSRPRDDRPCPPADHGPDPGLRSRLRHVDDDEVRAWSARFAQAVVEVRRRSATGQPAGAVDQRRACSATSSAASSSCDRAADADPPLGAAGRSAACTSAGPPPTWPRSACTSGTAPGPGPWRSAWNAGPDGGCARPSSSADPWTFPGGSADPRGGAGRSPGSTVAPLVLLARAARAQGVAADRGLSAGVTVLGAPRSPRSRRSRSARCR